jgi:hypothetical protein
MAVAKMNRDRPASVIRKPRINAGTVLAIRWSQFECSSGAKTMPIRPSVSKGRMPFRSRLWLVKLSHSSMTYSSTTKLTIVMPPTIHAGRFFGAVGCTA